MIRVEATPAVIKARDKCRTPGVVDAFNKLVNALKEDPQQGLRPDKAGIWQRVWPGIPNHRHWDLPAAWRATWTVWKEGSSVVVTILFLGTQKQYEEKYGF